MYKFFLFAYCNKLLLQLHITFVLYRKKRKLMIDVQTNTFRRQSICSTLILGPAVIVAFVLVNYFPGNKYDATVILDNVGFNLLVFSVLAMAVLSLLLSIKSSLSNICNPCNELNRCSSEANGIDEDIGEMR